MNSPKLKHRFPLCLPSFRRIPPVFLSFVVQLWSISRVLNSLYLTVSPVFWLLSGERIFQLLTAILEVLALRTFERYFHWVKNC